MSRICFLTSACTARVFVGLLVLRVALQLAVVAQFILQLEHWQASQQGHLLTLGVG